MPLTKQEKEQRDAENMMDVEDSEVARNIQNMFSSRTSVYDSQQSKLLVAHWSVIVVRFACIAAGR